MRCIQLRVEATVDEREGYNFDVLSTEKGKPEGRQCHFSGLFFTWATYGQLDSSLQQPFALQELCGDGFHCSRRRRAALSQFGHLILEIDTHLRGEIWCQRI